MAVSSTPELGIGLGCVSIEEDHHASTPTYTNISTLDAERKKTLMAVVSETNVLDTDGHAHTGRKGPGTSRNRNTHYTLHKLFRFPLKKYRRATTYYNNPHLSRDKHEADPGTAVYPHNKSFFLFLRRISKKTRNATAVLTSTTAALAGDAASPFQEHRVMSSERSRRSRV